MKISPEYKIVLWAYLNPKQRKAKKKYSRFPIKLRVEKATGKYKYLTLDITPVEEKYWDAERQTVTPDSPEFDYYDKELSKTKERLRRITAAAELENRILSADGLIEAFEEKQLLTYFTDFAQEVIDENPNVTTQSEYNKQLRNFNNFLGGRRLLLREITYERIVKYKQALEQKGRLEWTVYNSLKFVKGVMNEAVKRGKIEYQNNPFHHITLHRPKTRKEHVETVDLQKYFTAELKEGSAEWHARNYWKFSLFTRGMPWWDLAVLTHEQITGKEGKVYLEYSRHKVSNSILRVELIAEAIEILEYYRVNNKKSPFVFPIHSRKSYDRWERIKSGQSDKTEEGRFYNCMRNMNYKINEGIRAGCEIAGIRSNFTFHASRHTVGNLMDEAQSDTRTIAAALGHSSDATTKRFYMGLKSQKAADDDFKLSISKALKSKPDDKTGEDIYPSH